MAVAHLVWLLLALLLTYALLGLAQNAEVLQLPVEVFLHAHDVVLPSTPFLHVFLVLLFLLAFLLNFIIIDLAENAEVLQIISTVYTYPRPEISPKTC